MHDDDTLGPGAVDETLTAPTVEGELPTAVLAKRVGRYALLEQIGAGGMGVVFAAYDPDLDRKIAVKFLRPEVGGAEGTERLLREAQAMARLSHPNVATAYDVGTVDGQVFVAMEYVDGTTLREWLESPDERDWDEVWEVFRQAALGLQAAHDADIVHRDFKPSNVLIDRDGNAVVTDFGLARSAGAVPSEDLDSATALDSPLTLTGCIVGTPRYMPPEQHRGEVTDARGDQFSFCVALYQALYGEAPFAGESVSELEASVSAGELRPVPSGATVPAWRRDIVVRGLASTPEERWPSMRALVDALDHDPVAARQRRLRRAGGVVAFGAVAAAAVFGLARGGDTTEPACANAAARIDSVWNAARKEAVRAAFTTTERANAAEMFGLVDAAVDRYGATWSAARIDACEATHVRREQSEATLDLRMRCLDRRLTQLDALLTVFADEPSAALLDGASRAVASLGSVDACDDVEALSAVVPPPEDPTTRSRVEALRADLDRVNALQLARRFEEGRQLVDRVVADARALGYAPLLAESLVKLGKYQREAEEYTDSEASLREALGAAARARDDNLIAEIWTQLIYALGDQKRFDELERWTEFAQAAVLRAGNKAVHRAFLANSLAAAANERGKYTEARALYEEAAALYEEAAGPDHPNIAVALLGAGSMADKEGKPEESIALQQRVLDRYERTLGPTHPYVAGAHYQMGGALVSLERLDEARVEYQRALETFEALEGKDSSTAAMAHHGLGNVALSAERYDEALREYRLAAAAFETTFGPDDFRLSVALNGVASALDLMGRPKEAFEPMQRSYDIAVATYGAEHPRVAPMMHNLGDLYFNAGELDKAKTYLERALVLKTTTLGAEHPAVVSTTRVLARLYLARGDRAKAVRFAERALALQEKHATGEGLRQEQWVLAQVLGRGSKRAVELAEAARAGFEAAKEPDEVAAVTAWLDAP